MNANSLIATTKSFRFWQVLSTRHPDFDNERTPPVTATVTTRPDIIYIFEFPAGGGNVFRLSDVDAQRILDGFPVVFANEHLVVLHEDGETAILHPETHVPAFTLTTDPSDTSH